MNYSRVIGSPSPSPHFRVLPSTTAILGTQKPVVAYGMHTALSLLAAQALPNDPAVARLRLSTPGFLDSKVLVTRCSPKGEERWGESARSSTISEATTYDWIEGATNQM
jgi:hypothetical protein